MDETCSRITRKIVVIIIVFSLSSVLFNNSSLAEDGISPDLKIDYVEFPESLEEEQLALVTVKIKNYGPGNVTSGENITVILKDEVTVIDLNYTIGGLTNGSTIFLNVSGIPVFFGNRTFRLELLYEGDIVDYLENEIFIKPKNPVWWNKNWHYRHFIQVNGSGNISTNVNFTGLLADLGLVGKTFENTTIRIVEYKEDGYVKNCINNFTFDESKNFNNVTNADGTLIWNVPTDASYFYVYFDVKINPGKRTSAEEKKLSKDINVTVVNQYTQGWDIDILNPTNHSYHALNQSKKMIVDTWAIAKNTTAKLYYNNNEIKEICLNNKTGNTTWYYPLDFLNKTGSWKVEITSIDKAGYSVKKTHVFSVERPDLVITDLSFFTDWEPSSPKVYIGDEVTFKLVLTSYYAPVDMVEVSMYKDNDFFDQKTFNVSMSPDSTIIYFYWKPEQLGIRNISFIIDHENKIEEVNNSNNKYDTNVTVYAWPDLKIEKIQLLSDSVSANDEARFRVMIRNVGYVEAKNYEIGLFLVPIKQNFEYANQFKRDSNIISLVEEQEAINVTMVWSNSHSGEWNIGIKIFESDTKRDANEKDNCLISDETLTVYEKTSPIISNIAVNPSDSIEQGESVFITADIEDQTGIREVMITLEDPDGVRWKEYMLKTGIPDEYIIQISNASTIGRYNFTIKATDISSINNYAEENSSFKVLMDNTHPFVEFFESYPDVQLNDGWVDIVAWAYDNINIENVQVIIVYPDDEIKNEDMEYVSNSKFVYFNNYSDSGRYRFSIKVVDTAGNIFTTNNSYFWITDNLEDIDSDGIPNNWEEKYGLNPRDPSDSKKDADKDGITNLKEYNRGTNPNSDVLSENISFRISKNLGYLSLSVILFIILVILSYLGFRGRTL